jgi:putative Holliday junction resolvase
LLVRDPPLPDAPVVPLARGGETGPPARAERPRPARDVRAADGLTLRHPPPRFRAVRYLGLDLGRATIGLALADDVLRTARALRTLRRARPDADLAALKEIAAEYEVTRAILGLPLNMDGSEGSSARHARSFAAKLEAGLGIPVELFDERLSTFEASTRLRDQGFAARDQKDKIDAEAAAVILQGWLDRRER